MKKTKLISALTALLLAVTTVLSGCGSQKTPDVKDPDDGTGKTENAAFEPKLDTSAAVNIDIAVFFGNFEALDEVINHFNEFYPNVTINYERYGDTSSDEFLKTNPSLDIFMTSNEKGYPTEACVDLIEAGVDVSSVSEEIIRGNKSNGTLYTLPMSLNLKGLVVNRTLLAKEGLNVPETWSEFLNVLEALKQKGYTPIQGPNSAVGTLCYNMGMSMLAKDSDLLAAAKAGDEAGASALKSVYERIQTLVDKGYIDTEVNATYPNDNYDGAIMKFFEGDVPFWVCDTEKVSGMKKRETKSEAFKANPIEYEFMFAPLGENGAYEYIEPWYGFAVNKDSDVKDYAVEFLRFMARQDELNTLASIKGVPSVTKVSPDTRYANIAKAKVELSVTGNGSVPSYCGTLLDRAASELLNANGFDAQSALKSFLQSCAETSWEN